MMYNDRIFLSFIISFIHTHTHTHTHTHKTDSSLTMALYFS